VNQAIDGTERRGVTLARVVGAEQGRTYTTVVFEVEADGRGEHMRRQIKRRRVRRVP
jgi:hypothetical protein